MADRERAKAQRAVARSVEKGTRRSLEPFPCDAERPEGQTPASAGGCADAATADAYQCADDSSRQGVGLGPWGAVLFASEPAAALEVPPGAEPAGYAKVIVDYGLTVTPPHRLTFIGSRGGKTITERNGRTIVVLPPGYRPSPALTSQLAFALKYDGVNLEVLAALFRRVDSEAFERELAGFLAAHPTSQYSRRIWFLYEFLTDRRLPIDDIQAALRYVPLLDEREYFTAPRAPSRRHRVIDNLLGTRAFCPMVRRTERLRDFEARSLGEEARRIVAEFDEDAIRRAVSYLYSKETRSSFGIEGERLSTSRTERFVDLLRTVPELTSLTREHLVRLQAATVDPRFAEDGYRNDQVYVAEPMDLVRQRIHFIAPRPEDVPSMMEGLLACQRRLEGSQVDPVVLSASAVIEGASSGPFEGPSVVASVFSPRSLAGEGCARGGRAGAL